MKCKKVETQRTSYEKSIKQQNFQDKREPIDPLL